MATEYIPISQLREIDNISQADELLLSRHDHSTGHDIITSYKANAYVIQQNISNWVATDILEKYCVPRTAELHELENAIQTDYNEKKLEIDSLSNRLENEWYDLSTKFKNDWHDLSTRLKNTCDTMDSLCVTVSSEISTFIICSETSVKLQMEWITNYVKDRLSIDIANWANSRFVTLTGNETITGVKTFTKDIAGTALSAKWI